MRRAMLIQIRTSLVLWVVPPATQLNNSKCLQLCRKYDSLNIEVVIGRAVMLGTNLSQPKNFSRRKRMFLCLKLLIKDQLAPNYFRVSQENQPNMIYLRCQRALVAAKTKIRWHNLKQEEIYLNPICKALNHPVAKCRFSASNNHN